MLVHNRVLGVLSLMEETQEKDTPISLKTLRKAHAQAMSSESNPSLSITDRIIEINRENESALVDVMVKYDEMCTLMGEAATALEATIKSGLHFTVTLLAVANDIIHNGA